MRRGFLLPCITERCFVVLKQIPGGQEEIGNCLKGWQELRGIQKDRTEDQASHHIERKQCIQDAAIRDERGQEQQESQAAQGIQEQFAAFGNEIAEAVCDARNIRETEETDQGKYAGKQHRHCDPYDTYAPSGKDGVFRSLIVGKGADEPGKQDQYGKEPTQRGRQDGRRTVMVFIRVIIIGKRKGGAVC